jgi:hypothetical protein
MRLRVLTALVGLLLVAGPVLAADVDGKWLGSIDTPGGAMPVSFNFRADGATLNGTTGAPDGSGATIKNGKIDGDKISFNVDFDFGGTPVSLAYTGIVLSDQITGHF